MAYEAPQTAAAMRTLPGPNTIALVQEGWIACTASNEVARFVQKVHAAISAFIGDQVTHRVRGAQLNEDVKAGHDFAHALGCILTGQDEGNSRPRPYLI